MSPVRAVLLALVVLVAASPLAAQVVEPKRPKLPAGADTNSANAYYRLGINELRDDPGTAERAFYWAWRLEPGWADPLYARRIALHLTDLRRFGDYLDRKAFVMKSKEVRSADSLQYEAMLRNPLLFQGLGREMIEYYFERSTGLTAAMIDWGKQDPEVAGWLAYTKGNHAEAVDLYAKAIKRWPKLHYLHGDRARSFHLLGQLDSAVAETQLMVDGLRAEDQKSLVRFYESKGLGEYQIGFLWLNAGQKEKAKAAFQRALTEDLGMPMAHAQLGEIAASEGDMETALLEWGQAVELSPKDPMLRVGLARRLMEARKWEEALPHLQQSVALDPWYAMPYLFIGQIQQSAGEDAAAKAAYEAYIARAPRSAERELNAARARLAQLAGGQ